MRTILLLMTLCLAWASAACAIPVEVQDQKVTIKINGHSKTLSVGDKLDLKEGETLCFEKGQGKIVIAKKFIITGTSNSLCYQSPIAQRQSILNQLWASLENKFGRSKAQATAGVNRSTDTVAVTILHLPRNQYLPFVLLVGKTWGEEALQIDLMDEEGHLLRTVRVDAGEQPRFIKLMLGDLPDHGMLHILPEGGGDTLAEIPFERVDVNCAACTPLALKEVLQNLQDESYMPALLALEWMIADRMK